MPAPPLDGDRPRCRRGPRCTDREPASTPLPGTGSATGSARWVGCPDVGPGGLCPSCARHAWYAVYDLPGDVAELEAMVTDTERTPTSNRDATMPGATSKDTPCELDLRADALARQLVHEVTTWAENLDAALEERDAESRTLSQRWDPDQAGRRPYPRALAAADYLCSFWGDVLALDAFTYRAHDGRQPDEAGVVVHTEPAPVVVFDRARVAARQAAHEAAARASETKRVHSAHELAAAFRVAASERGLAERCARELADHDAGRTRDVHDVPTGWISRDGGSAACAFLDLHHRVASFAGRTDPPTRYPDRPCPHCARVGLLVRRSPARVGGPAPVWCEGCAREVAEQTFDQALDALMAGHSAEQVAGVVSATEHGGRGWALDALAHGHTAAQVHLVIGASR